MNNVPNLDDMPATELMSFWQRHKGGCNVSALFPLGGKGSRIAARDLAAYASTKAAAIELRLRGEISAAQHYEEICESIYNKLPATVQW